MAFPKHHTIYSFLARAATAYYQCLFSFLTCSVVSLLYGFASRWLGSLKGKLGDPNHIIGVFLGNPLEPSIRNLADFERKSVAEIVKGADLRMEAVRLAPSGLNKQPWYFIKEGEGIHVCYKKSLGGLLGMLYRLTCLDVGLHFAFGCSKQIRGYTF